MDDQDRLPEWLTTAIALAAADAEDRSLDARMHAAGQVAYSIARLRAERRSAGFAPLPFVEYVCGLAARASVAIAPVFEWASMEGGVDLTTREAAGIGRLAHALDFSKDEMLMALRVAVAERVFGGPLPLLAAYRGQADMVTPRQCERMLTQVETGWNSAQRAEADALAAAATAAFRQRDDSSPHQ